LKKGIWRLLFSRYAVCALTIAAEVLFIALVTTAASVFSYAFLIVSAIVDLFAVVAIINQDVNPEYKVTWTVLVLLLPLFGTILYVLFYRRRITKSEQALLEGIFTKIRAQGTSRAAFDMMRRRSPLAAGKARAIMNDDPLAEVYCKSSSTFFLGVP